MAGIGDSWGTREELLHPRGPDGRWIRKAGVAKSIIDKVLNFLASFRPRQFQSRGQASQYAHNLAGRAPRRMGRMDHARLLSDLSAANEDLRDGNIDNPSTQRFVEMMDRSSTELPDDVILTRIVGTDAFGFTPETAVGTDSDSNPGIRGMSGKLIADRGYGLTTIGGPSGTKPQGTVQMVVAAGRGTKVIPPGASPNDPTMFIDRDQPLRVTKVQPDGMGGWTMYVTTEERGRTVPEPIGGPVGEAVPDTKEREARIRRVGRISATREKRPDEVAEQADIEARAARAAEMPPSAGQVEEERRRQAELQQPQQPQQPAPPGTPPPRTEPVVVRSLGGEPRPATGPGGVPQGQAPGAVPEAPAAPRRTVDLRQAVRQAGIPAPAAGPNRKRFNDAYEGVISGKKDPIDATRELDRDAADLEAAGDADADNLRQLSDVIKREYGLEQPAPAKKAAKAAAPEAPSAPEAPPPVAKKAPAKKAGAGLTPEQEEGVIARARQFRGNERNSEEERIVGLADDILARREGRPVPSKALRAPVKKAASAAPEALTPEQEIKGLFGGKRPTNAQLREMGERNNLGFGPKEPRSEMILAILGARPSRGRQRGEVPVKAPAKKASTSDRVTDLLLERMKPDVRERILADMPEDERRAVDEAVERVRAAKKAVPEAPSKKVAKKAAKAAPEAPGEDLDKMTKAELLDEAKRLDITAPKSWNKDRIKKLIREEKFRFPEEKTPEQRRELRRTQQGLDEEFRRREAAGEGIPQPSAAPEAPAPVKKAAKAAVPGAAPGTAAGKITAGRLQPGMRILVGPTGGHTDRKTGAKVATITSIDRFSQGGRTRSQTRIQINAIDEDGKPFIVGQGTATVRSDRVGFSPSQTFMAAPEPGAAPVKKAAKAAAPKRMTKAAPVKAAPPTPPTPDSIRQQLVSMPPDQHFPFMEDTLQPLNLTQSRALARSLGVKGAGRSEKPEIALRIAQHFEGAGDVEAARRLGGPDLEEEGRQRQAQIDRVKGYGKLGSEVSELIDNEASSKALSHRLTTRARQEGLEADLGEVQAAIDAGEHKQAQQLLEDLMRQNGVTLTHRSGDIVPLDRPNMIGIDDRGVPGDVSTVRVVRPGYEITLPNGEKVRERSKVEPATPDEIADLERRQRGEDLVPDGSVTGDRAQVPVRTTPRSNAFDEAWDKAKLDAEGSPGRSMREIQRKVSSGKLTPEEGIQQMEGEIAFNKEDLAEVDANLRQPDLSDEERTKLQTNAKVLRDGIKAQEKASRFMRRHFKDEKPTVEEVKVQLGPEEFRVLQDATPETLREAAKEAGLEPPKGETKDEILQDLVRQIAGQVARERGLIPKKAPAKKAVKAAKKAAPSIPAQREKLDVRTIGAGIELDESDKWTKDVLDEAQKSLDAGESPASISRHMEDRVRSRRTTNVYENASWHAEDRPWRTPEETAEIKARNKAEFDRVHGLTDQVERLAERLKQTRRRPVKKAAAPETQRVQAQLDDVQARLINQRLADLDKAKTRYEAGLHLDGLTMPELRRIGDQIGARGNSKQALRDRILDHFKPNAPEGVRPMGVFSDNPEIRRQAEEGIEALGRAQQVTRGGSLSRRAKDAGIPSPIRTFSGVDPAIGEADRRLKAGDSHTEVARFLRERAADVARADLNEEGRRFRTEQDRDTLKSLRKSNAEYLRRVATHVQQEGKATKAAPAKKAAPVKKAAPPVKAAPVTTPAILARLNDQENQLSREEAADLVAPLSKALLQDMAKELNVPRRTTLTKPELRREIVEATVGRRLDSIAIRGFTGRRPGKEQGRGLAPGESPVEAVRAEQAAKKAASGRPALSVVRGEGRGRGPGAKRPALTVVQPGTQKSTKQPMANSWGGEMSPVHFHEDGIIGMALDRMGDSKLLDVDGEPLQDVLGKLATRAVRGEISQQQLIQELRQLSGRFPDNSTVKRQLDRMIDQLDAPEVDPPTLPEGTPAPLTTLLQRLAQVPLARGSARHGQGGTVEMDAVVQAAKDYQQGVTEQGRNPRLMLRRLSDDLRTKAYNHRHESQEGKFEIDRAIREAMREIEELEKALVRR